MKDLFGDDIPAEKAKPNQTVYYLSVSAMQKCIRRGETERAINFAKVAYRQNGYKTFGRLWTILFEDCGTSLEALKVFNNYPIGSKTFSDLIPLIKSLSNSVKDTLPVFLSSVIKGACWGVTLPPVPLYLKLKDTPFRPAIEWYKQWPEDKLEVFDSLDYDDELKWLPRLCKLGCKFDYSKFALGVPLLLHESGINLKTSVVPNNSKLTYFKDFLPLEAVDVHTRQGKFALNIFLKKVSSALPRDVIRESLFYLEGVVHNQRRVREVNLRTLLWELVAEHSKLTFLPQLTSPEAQDFWLNNSDQLNSIRTWVLNTHFEDDLELLQAEYEKDLINVEKEKPDLEPLDSRR